MAVTVTDTALREIANIIKQQDLDPEKIRLRVGVKGGGCSGFSYLLDLTETQKDTDEVWEFQTKIGGENGADGDAVTVRVVCDPKSYLYLNGTTVDFRDEIMGRGFVFNNPNATSTCGCGSSFSA
jgi:iron-sulfur cluster assembly protein